MCVATRNYLYQLISIAGSQNLLFLHHLEKIKTVCTDLKIKSNGRADQSNGKLLEDFLRISQDSNNHLNL